MILTPLQPEHPDRDETVQINNVFGNGSEWITLGELGTELQRSLSEVYVNSFRKIEDKTFANDFLRLSDVIISKNTYKVTFRFLRSEKREVRILGH